MTVPSTKNVKTHLGNGVTTVFPFDFRIFQAEDLEVSLTLADDTIVPWSLGTDYTVAEKWEDVQSGGEIIATTAPDDGTTLVIRRVLQPLQETDLRNQGAYYAEVVERVFDRLTMLIQQVIEDAGRSLKHPIGEDFWDGEGKAIKNIITATIADAKDVANVGWVQEYVTDILAGGGGAIPETYLLLGDGVETTFPLPGIEISASSAYTVTIDGLDMRPKVNETDDWDYRIDVENEQIIFLEPPPAPASAGDKLVMVRVLGYKRGITQGDATIVTADGASTSLTLSVWMKRLLDAESAIQKRVKYVANVTELRTIDGAVDDQVVTVKNDPNRLDGTFVAETSAVADDGVDVFVSANGKRFRRAKIATSNGRVVLEIADSASKSHLLLRNVTPGATRMHVEPNGHVDSGTITKQDWMFDPYNEDQSNYRIINIYTKQGAGAGYNGQNGVAVLGAKGAGDHFGIFPSINVGFSDDNANGVPLKVMYFDTSDTEWRTPLLGAWREGRDVSLGDYILANFKLYQADGAGTTGATKPSHSSGSASDGGVSWTFVRDYQAAAGSIKPCVVIGDRDDMPKFGFPNARAQFAGSAVVWNGEKFQFLDDAGSAVWEIGVDLNTDDFHIRSLTGGGSLRFDAPGSFVQNSGLAYLLTSLTEDSESATVAVGKTEMLSLNNANPTNITQFTGLPYQRFYVQASNSNTTLVHGTNLKLAGGVNRVVTGDDTLQFVLNASGTTAKQVVS